MTHGQAFLDAVLADPESDGPRLLMADYLDDAGQSERAEFVRIQVALATMAESGSDARKDIEAFQKRFAALADREQVLAAEHCYGWLPKAAYYFTERTWRPVLWKAWAGRRRRGWNTPTP